MKKILPTLLILLLSMAVIGCGPLEEEEDVPCAICGADNAADCICKAASASALSPDAKAALVSLVGQDFADGFPVPQGTTFYKHEAGGKFIAFYWTGANQAMFDYYKAAWLSRAATQVIGEKTDGKFVAATKIAFEDVEGSSLTEGAGAFTYPANTIIFSGTAN